MKKSKTLQNPTPSLLSRNQEAHNLRIQKKYKYFLTWCETYTYFEMCNSLPWKDMLFSHKSQEPQSFTMQRSCKALAFCGWKHFLREISSSKFAVEISRTNFCLRIPILSTLNNKKVLFLPGICRTNWPSWLRSASFLKRLELQRSGSELLDFKGPLGGWTKTAPSGKFELAWLTAVPQYPVDNENIPCIL